MSRRTDYPISPNDDETCIDTSEDPMAPTEELAGEAEVQIEAKERLK